MFPATRSVPEVKSVRFIDNGEFSDSSDPWNFAAREVAIKINEILLEFFERLALSQVIRELFEVAEPHFTVLPTDIACRAHSFILLLAATAPDSIDVDHPGMDNAFDLIEQAARQGGADSALDLLVTISQKDKNYPLLFEARLMQARHKIGLPLIFNAPLEDLPAEQRQAYEEAMRDAARETGNLFLADGDIPRAWPYFRAIGDPAPVAAAIEKIDSHDQLDGIIEIAFGQGVHPRKGFELLLKTHGICRAITFFGAMSRSQKSR